MLVSRNVFHVPTEMPCFVLHAEVTKGYDLESPSTALVLLATELNMLSKGCVRNQS